MSRSRDKGTGYEREVLLALQKVRPNARRASANSQFDLESQGPMAIALRLLATRPDRGRTLITMTLTDFLELLDDADEAPFPNYTLLIECKRRKTYAHHSLFESETRG